MVVITALTDDKRWAGASPSRKPGGARAPNPINLPSQRLCFPKLDSHGLGCNEGIVPNMDVRGTATWGNRVMSPAPNAWGLPLLLHPKNDEDSGAPSHIDDCPSSRGSSASSSTVGSDFLDFLSSHSQTAKGSLQPSHLPGSFSDVLKAPLRTIGKQAPTSHGNGFNLSMDDFPVLGSKNSKPNSQQGHSTYGRLISDSDKVAARDEQRKSLIIGVGEVLSSSSYEHENVSRTDYIYKGVDPVPATKLMMQAQQAQLHGPQAPNIRSSPPCLDYWHPPPDQPPDKSGILQKGAAPYGPYKHADSLGSFAVESCGPYGQFQLNQEAAARQGPGEGDSRDPYHPHMLADPRVINQPPRILGKVKDGQFNALERQPIIKKDVALLEKIKCLNNKVRNLCALNLSKLSTSKESEIKHPKNIGAEAGHVTKDVPLSAATSEIFPAFDWVNSFSASSSLVPTNPPNVSANGVIAVALSEGQVAEFSEAGNSGKPADYHAYGRGTTSINRHDSSARDASSRINGHGQEEHSTVDSLRDVVVTRASQSQHFPMNTSHEVRMTSSDKVLSWLDYEVQHSRMKYLSAQAAKQLHDAEDWITQQNAKAIAKLEELTRRPSVQSEKLNDAPLEADNLHCGLKMGGHETTEQDSFTADRCCIVSADALNAPRLANGVKNIAFSIGSTPASNTTGVSKGLLIHNVISSAKNKEVSMMEHIVHRSISQSEENSAPKHRQMENRQREFDSRDRNVKDRSNGAESAKFIKNIVVTPVDAESAESKPHEDLLTRNKNIWVDTAAVRPASPPVFVKNTSVVSTLHKKHVPCVAIDSSMVPVQVTSVTGVTVGSIMLEDVSLASVNQEWPTAAKGAKNTKSSIPRPQQTKKSGKNQHGVLPVENPLWNDNVMCTPVNLPSKKEHNEEGSVNSMSVAAPTRPSGNHSIISEDVEPTKSTEIDGHNAPHQENLGQMLPAEDHIFSYDHLEESNLATKSHDKEALADLHDTKAKVATELGNWLDRKSSCDHERRPRHSWKQKSTDKLALVVQNLAEPAGYFNVADVVQESYNPWQQVKEQFETMTQDTAEDCSKSIQTVPMPSSTWEPLSVNTRERRHASDSPRRYHVEGRRNVGSNNYGYKERAGTGRFFHETPAPSRAHWIPKYISRPHSNAQDNGVSECLWDSQQPISETDDSQGFHSKQSQIVDRDGEMELIGEQVSVDMGFRDENTVIWSEKEWEYQQLNPAPHPHEQHEVRHHIGHDRYWRRGGDAGEPTYNTKEAKRKGGGRHSEYQPKGLSNVGNGVHGSSNQWPQVEQFESKSHDGTKDISEPVNPWKRHPEGHDQRRLHLKGQRNVGSNYAYKERVGTGCFFPDPPASSKARSYPHINVQDNGVTKCLWDSQQGLSDMDNSEGLGGKGTRMVGKDGDMRRQGKQVNAGMSLEDENLMIWNEREWEYEQLCPTPHHHGHHDGTHHGASRDGYRGSFRGGHMHMGRGRGRYRGRGRGTGELTYDANEDTQRGRFRHSNRQG